MSRGGTSTYGMETADCDMWVDSLTRTRRFFHSRVNEHYHEASRVHTRTTTVKWSRERARARRALTRSRLLSIAIYCKQRNYASPRRHGRHISLCPPPRLLLPFNRNTFLAYALTRVDLILAPSTCSPEDPVLPSSSPANRIR